MQRTPWPDTMPHDAKAEALIARLALGRRRVQPLELPPELKRRAQERQQADDTPAERDRPPQMLAWLLVAVMALLACAGAAHLAAWLWPLLRT